MEYCHVEAEKRVVVVSKAPYTNFKTNAQLLMKRVKLVSPYTVVSVGVDYIVQCKRYDIFNDSRPQSEVHPYLN